MEEASDAADFIARDRPLVGRRWKEGLVDAVRRLEDFPESGRVVPDANNPSVREVIYTPYRVMYRIDPDEVVVLQLLHFRRDLILRRYFAD